MKRLSVVIPFFNEEKILKEKVEYIYNYLQTHFKDFELLLIDDGSTDLSNKIAKSFLKQNNQITLITSKPNAGRGNAIRKGLMKSSGDIVGYLDADLEIKIEYLKPALKMLSSCDVVIVSKFARDARVEAPALRKISSHIFNLLVNIILNSGLTDHQAGFKFFKKEVIENTLSLSEQNGWLWDIEILYLAKKKRYTIKELPIEIRYGYRNIRSTFISDFLKMPLFVIQLKRNIDKKLKNGKK